ncbi:hypothetical protein [Actinosynnema sp. NPDC023587]|uniref:hypothetical protein n=1 Tax=Actinosynnema sp. NPDC023587 TaxID=3154695 RepID=UPI003410BAC8
MPKSRVRKPKKKQPRGDGRRPANRSAVHSGQFPDQTKVAFSRPPWDTYLYTLEELDAGTAPPGAEKFIAQVPFSVSWGTAEDQSYTLTSFAKWIQTSKPRFAGKSLEEMCDVMADLVDQGFLFWDPVNLRVLLTLPRT